MSCRAADFMKWAQINSGLIVFTGGQAFVQCGISKRAKSSKEVALIHSSLSAIAINDFIASLELKGMVDDMLWSSYFGHAISPPSLMQSEETINIFHFRLCSL